MPRESKVNLKKRCGRIFAELAKLYPKAACALVHRNELQLLVATILSAQCTDVRVNIITRQLFKKYKTVAHYAAVGQEQLEGEIRTAGFYRNKAKNIRGSAKMIIEHFGGKVPDTMNDLLSLPGVARKTANVVLSTAFGKNEGFVVDTHVKRLSGRLGLSKQKTPEKIERDLMALTERDNWGYFSHLLVFHGRQVCTARKPDCPACPLNKKNLCHSAIVD